MVPLGEVAEFINGAAFKPTDWDSVGARIIRIQNLNDPSKPYNRTQREVSKKLHVHPGDLLVSWSASLGVFEWDQPDVALLNQHIFRVLPKDELVRTDYLRHMLFDALESMKKHLHGATMMHVNRAEFLATRIPLPALDEQRRIAAILDKADELRAKRREALAHLDTLTQSIFHDSVANAPVTTSIGLEEAFWFQEGPGIRKWQFTEDGVKLLNVGNILRDGTIDLEKTARFISREEASGKYAHFQVDAGDLVIASSGIAIDEDGLLRTRGSFVDESQLPLCMNTSTIRFKAKEGISTLPFLQGWIQSIEFRRQISKFVTGSAQLNFGPSHLRQLLVSLPGIAEQREFATRVAAVERLKEHHRSQLAQLDALFASLQHRAFKGEL